MRKTINPTWQRQNETEGCSAEMSQQDAIRFLHDQGLPADTIHQHLAKVLREKATACSTVMRILGEMSWTGPENPKG
jgi:hypothetical protein